MITTLGEKLRLLRHSRQYTQQQLSNHLHLERAAYANYENGRRSPSYQHIARIADYYKVPADYLIRDDYDGDPCHKPCLVERDCGSAWQDFCLLDANDQGHIADYLRYLRSLRSCAKAQGHAQGTR